MSDLSNNYPILATISTCKCSHSTTASDYYYQPWATCQDCFGRNDGACLACLQTCHKGHRLGTIQYGPFFCDCALSNKCKLNPKQTVPKNTIDSSNTLIASNKFDWKLFDILDKNTICSPLSIGFMLSVLGLSSSGNIKQQLIGLLGYKSNINNLIKVYNLFNNDTIKLTNVLIVNNGFQIDKSYHDQINQIAMVFHNTININETVEHINNYIEKTTNGQITTIVQPENINTNTGSALSIINTIYFKASWNKSFDNKYNRFEPFGENTGTDTSVVMMTQTNYFPYYENNQIQVLQMFYKNTDYVMGFILMNKGNFADDLSTIIPDHFTNAMVEVHIPKFTQKSRLNLIPMLQKLGLTDIFTSSTNISLFVHEAVVIVDDTAIDMTAPTIAAIHLSIHKPIIFYANRAFVYYIKHIPTNTILFIGNYVG